MWMVQWTDHLILQPFPKGTLTDDEDAKVEKAEERLKKFV